MRITGHLKNYFLRGLAVLVPTILTIWIFIWGYEFIQNSISVYINHAGVIQSQGEKCAGLLPNAGHNNNQEKDENLLV
jgi:uncharacterized membrane protein